MIGRLMILALGVVSLLAGVFFSCQMWRYRELAEGIAWLEDRTFPSATLITVGTGGAYENLRRLGPATAVGFGKRIVLVDAGRGVAEALRHCLIPIVQPDTIVLTSLLPENTLGLDDLLLTGWNTPRSKPLRLLGPPGTRARADAIEAAYAASIDTLAAARGVAVDGARLEVVEIGDGFVEERDGLTLRAGDAGDTPLPSLAYRFEASDRALVVAGANPDPERLVAFAQGATLLAGEGFFAESIEAAEKAEVPDIERLKREAALRMPMQELGAIATRAGVGMLVVTRLQTAPLFDAQYETAAGATFGGALVIADECAEITP